LPVTAPPTPAVDIPPPAVVVQLSAAEESLEILTLSRSWLAWMVFLTLRPHLAA